MHCVLLHSVYREKQAFLPPGKYFRQKKKKRFEKARTSIRKKGGGEAGDFSFAHVEMQI